MKYRQLLQQLSHLTEEQLDQDVTVYLTDQDEYFTLASDYPFGESLHLEEDRLDNHHFYLRV